MSYTLLHSQNLANTLIQYAPLNAGLGQEPMVSIGSMIRSTILSEPFVWTFNRKEDSSTSTTTMAQDYTILLTDFGFLEKVSLTDSTGKIWEVKEVQNIAPLAKNADSSRPLNVALLTKISGTSVTFRFSSKPDAIYTINIVYQKEATIMGPFFLTQVGAASGSTAVYIGVFNPLSFPAGSTAQITGFTRPQNNGSFLVVSCTATTLVVQNPSAISEGPSTAYASNFDWAPIPDSYSYIYNSLFIGEALALVDDNRAMQYRMRGVAGLISKAEGLSETQKNVFMQMWLAGNAESAVAALRVQQSAQARGI